VKFGLSYKYQGSVPTSDKQFSMDFNAANLHFNANSISSLVISSSMATLTGSGTINGGSHTYNFLAPAWTVAVSAFRSPTPPIATLSSMTHSQEMQQLLPRLHPSPVM